MPDAAAIHATVRSGACAYHCLGSSFLRYRGRRYHYFFSPALLLLPAEHYTRAVPVFVRLHGWTGQMTLWRGICARTLTQPAYAVRLRPCKNEGITHFLLLFPPSAGFAWLAQRRKPSVAECLAVLVVERLCG